MKNSRKYWPGFYFILSKAVRGLFWYIPMWAAVITLCLIALPRHMSDQLLETVLRTSASSYPGSNARQNLPSSSTASNTNAPQALNNANATQASSADTNSVGLVARMALDASKEKYDSLKETQDRLFSIIAAVAALLVFLGFKGADSYLKIRDQAEAAAKETEEYKKFMLERYSKDNRAELNTASGAALRDIADMYNIILRKTYAAIEKKEKLSPDPSSDAEYKGYLEVAALHLETAVEVTTLDTQVACRALGTLGNVYKRLGRPRDALNVSKRIYEKFNPRDVDSYFNAACYLSLMAEQEAKSGNSVQAQKWGREAIDHIQKYLQLEDSPNAQSELSDEADLQWVKTQHAQDFATALTTKSPREGGLWRWLLPVKTKRKSS